MSAAFTTEERLRWERTRAAGYWRHIAAGVAAATAFFAIIAILHVALRFMLGWNVTNPALFVAVCGPVAGWLNSRDQWNRNEELFRKSALS
jgi:hypothetical protein